MARIGIFLASAIAVFFTAFLPIQTFAQGVGVSSGLPIPRFVSIRSSPVNVRVGPGTKYEVAWVFVQSSVPVEIVQEFDTWRKIRDVDGDEGWVQQSLVVSNRTAFVSPWDESAKVALFTANRANANVRAWLTSNILVSVRGCNGTLCEVRYNHHEDNGRTTTYSGYLQQQALWGVYDGEIFD